MGSKRELNRALVAMKARFPAESYNFFLYNCQTFALALLQQLMVDTHSIPASYVRFANSNSLCPLCYRCCCLPSAHAGRVSGKVGPLTKDGYKIEVVDMIAQERSLPVWLGNQSPPDDALPAGHSDSCDADKTNDSPDVKIESAYNA